MEDHRNKYEKLLDEFLDLTEFVIVRYRNGYGLSDNTGANIGNIEKDRFRNAADLIDRMDVYIDDFLVQPICECLNISVGNMTWGELAKSLIGTAGDSEGDVLMLDALCNHANEINLKNCGLQTTVAREVFVCYELYSAGLIDQSQPPEIRNSEAFVTFEDAVEWLLKSVDKCVEQGFVIANQSLKDLREDVDLLRVAVDEYGILDIKAYFCYQDNWQKHCDLCVTKQSIEMGC